MDVNKLRGNRHGELIDPDTLWMSDAKRYNEAIQHFLEAIGCPKIKKAHQILLIENPTGANFFQQQFENKE